jgi:transcriptional regulator with AAA-type ATPase domain
MSGRGVDAPDDVLTQLRGTRLWADAPDGTVRQAAGRMEPRRFSAGDVLIEQGAPGEALHLIVSGSVDVRVQVEDGAEVAIAALHQGECVGEMSLLTGDPASADVVAKGDVETLALSAADFTAVVATDSGLLREFVRILSDRLSHTDVAVSVARGKEQDLTEFLRETDAWDHDLVGTSAAVRKLRKEVEKLAHAQGPVLICGEVGSGRRVAANLLHRSTASPDALVIGVDCAQVQETDDGDRLFSGPGTSNGRPLCYLDLAEGGTLVLKNLERMPMGVQRRLARRLVDGSSRRNVRVVATCAPEDGDGGGQIAEDLRACFEERTIELSPLRDRKRDIPLLAARYLEKHASRLDKKVRAFDDQALTKLVSYDYHIANDRELEEAVERAVILTDGDTVEAEAVFLGPPPPPRTAVLNLFAIPKLNLRKVVGVLPRWIRVGTALLFALILFLAFFRPDEAQGSVVTLLVWGLWWPLLVLSFVLGGRAWCAACPVGLVTSTADRLHKTKRRIPAWLKQHDMKLAMAGLFLILFAEEALSMRHSPLATGWLLIAIIAGAAITGWLYPRRTWCRHVCPLGGLAGACATSGMLEIRPTFDVCSAKCKGHACYKGDGDVEGCPMFNHVMFVDTNQHCVMCMNCVQSCPNDSPQLNLRMPGREIWDGAAVSPKLGWFVLMLMGMLVGITGIQRLEQTPHAAFLEEHRFLLVAVILGVSAVIPLLLGRWISRAAEQRGESSAARFWNRVAAFAPVTTAGLVAYQLAYIPGLAGLQFSMHGSGPGASGLTVSVLGMLRVGVLLAGLLATLILLWRVNRRGSEEGAPPTPRTRRASLATALGFSAVLLVLMLTP